MNYGAMSAIKRISDGHVIERSSGMIIAWHNGRRTDESCRCLMDKLLAFYVVLYYTDDWKSCQQVYSFLKTCYRKSWHMDDRKTEF